MRAAIRKAIHTIHAAAAAGTTRPISLFYAGHPDGTNPSTPDQPATGQNRSALNAFQHGLSART